MDLIQLQKFHAIKRSKKHQLLNSFFPYSMALLTCSLLCSIPFWFPFLASSIKPFLFLSLPKISSVLLNYKLIFIVSNLIIILLIGESKFFASNSLPAASDAYYNEYINRKRSVQKSPILEVKKEGKIEMAFKQNASKACEGGKMEVKLLNDWKLRLENKKEDLDGEDDDDDGHSLPTEELNKRADDFIARVNRQRRMEARLLHG